MMVTNDKDMLEAISALLPRVNGELTEASRRIQYYLIKLIDDAGNRAYRVKKLEKALLKLILRELQNED